MGYYGKLEEKKLALGLRRQGYSYSEMRNQISVSKDTLSRWCRDVVLSPEQLELLRKKRIVGADKGRIIGAKRQQERRIKETARLFEEGKRETKELTKRERFIAGISLYIGDGYKNDKCIGFSNSDPLAIKFMANWLREFCSVPKEKFTGQIWIHDNLDEKAARGFWAEIAGIPEKRIVKSYIVKNKDQSRKIRKQLHKYGVFTLRVGDVNIQRKMLGWMAGILGSELV